MRCSARPADGRESAGGGEGHAKREGASEGSWGGGSESIPRLCSGAEVQYGNRVLIVVFEESGDLVEVKVVVSELPDPVEEVKDFVFEVVLGSKEVDLVVFGLHGEDGALAESLVEGFLVDFGNEPKELEMQLRVDGAQLNCVELLKLDRLTLFHLLKQYAVENGVNLFDLVRRLIV